MKTQTGALVPTEGLEHTQVLKRVLRNWPPPDEKMRLLERGEGFSGGDVC